VPVHLIHVSKSGGSALRFAIREARKKAGGQLETEWGPVWGHDHRFRMIHVERGDKVIFALRDPATRFVSGFYSRLRKGAPRYDLGWSAAEQQAFEWFKTPQALADALAGADEETRRRAVFAMGAIVHVNRPMTRWLGSPAYLYRNLDKVLYVARQESLAEDFEQIKEILDLPREQMLPDDDIIAHRTAYPDDRTLSEQGLRALQLWYAADYELLEIGDAVRAGREPPAPPFRQRLVAALGTVKPRRKFRAHRHARSRTRSVPTEGVHG
jgi:hypothetical protein